MTRLPFVLCALFVCLASVAGAQGYCPDAAAADVASGDIAANASVTIQLTLQPCETVVYAMQTTTAAQYGASISAKFYNSSGAELFSDSWFMNRSLSVTLPRVAPYMVPYRGTLGAAGRPARVVLRSLNYAISYSLVATRTPRAGYNVGGTGMADAPLIGLSQAQHGTIHPFEGAQSNLAGQWYKVALSPGQAIYLTGTALGHASYGGNLAIQLYDPNGVYVRDLVNVAAYGQVSFPSASQLRVYVHGGTQAATYFLRVYAPVWVCHDFSFMVKTPRLTAHPAEPIRGATASLVVEDAGGTATAWRFETPQGTVNRQSTGSLSWTGTMVLGGDASVTVTWANQTFTLRTPVPVLPRPNFVTDPVSPEDGNAPPAEPPVWTVDCSGASGAFADPPVAPAAFGYACTQTDTRFTVSPRIADDGPNRGFFYVTAITDDTRFRWWRHPLLNDAASAFFLAQYGNYNGSTGFIGGTQLSANVREHESGTIRGHYQQYRTAVTTDILNPGRQLEEEVGGPGVPSTQAFVTQVSNVITAINAAIAANASEEHYPCNSHVEWSPQCVFNGPVNFPPYQPQ